MCAKHILITFSFDICDQGIVGWHQISQHGRTPRPGSLRPQRSESHSCPALSCPSYPIIGQCGHTCAIHIRIQTHVQYKFKCKYKKIQIHWVFLPIRSTGAFVLHKYIVYMRVWYMCCCIMKHIFTTKICLWFVWYKWKTKVLCV